MSGRYSLALLAEKICCGDFLEDERAAKSPSIPSPRRRLYEPEAFVKGGR
jgi:hypothetical protein